MEAISPTISSTNASQTRDFFAKSKLAAALKQREAALAEKRKAAASPVISARWPTLGKAIGHYEESVAENFSKNAYERVQAGVIRLDERRGLAKLAEDLGIRPFDAQLLIACAIRQSTLDGDYDASPNPDAPALSFEFRAWTQTWLRIAIVIMMAVIFDGVILYRWLA